MRFLISALLGLAIIAGVIFFYPTPNTPATHKDTVVMLSDMVIEVVDTVATRERGLSGRTGIASDFGMLFVFEKADTYGFWMKDMFIPIDIVWLSDTGTILGIEHDVDPASYPNVFYAPGPVRYVLELSAGQSVRNHWIVGGNIGNPTTLKK